MKRHLFSLLTCLFSLLLCLGGCADREAPSGQSNLASEHPQDETTVSDDQGVYTFAPGAYVIHIVSGEAVVLDSVVRDFPIFPSAEEARAFLKKEAAAGRLDEKDWKIYRIYGNWKELSKPNPEGGYLLAKPAPLIDWVD